MTTELWHNPRCSKSRGTLELLEARSAPEALTIIRYLDTPPDRARLAEVVGLLGGDARVLLRAGEAPDGLADRGDDAILDALAETPALIQRPVVITPRGARIGRPPEAVLEIL